MAWASRPGGTYYYRNEWVDGRVVTRYFGRGPAAELAAGLDALARQRRRDEAEALRAEQARLRPLEAALAALDAACDLMVEAELTAAGYHRPNYGAWRRRRVRDDGAGPAGAARRC